MRCVISAVGKARKGPELELFQQYKTRLPWQVTLYEVEEKKPLPKEKRQAVEAKLLLETVPNGAYIIALDERGKTFTSDQFAKKISSVQHEGYSTFAFLIGGADGHEESVRQKAHLTLSFGSFTWPHMLVRAMLAEQLYRAWSIIEGHPYHRE